jgi:hypothetical protein
MQPEFELIIQVVLIIIIVCVAYWYLHQAKSSNSSSLELGATKIEVLPGTDSFLQKVASDKAEIDKATIIAMQQYENELEQRFANDVKYVKLMERLTQFARVNELDKALIALWEEIENYPEWSGQEDSDKWNKLNLIGISGSNEEDTSSVEFIRGAQQFRIRKRVQSGVEEEAIAGLSLFEDDNEVFAIDCLIFSSDEEARYICQRINTFKKRGNWAKTLLECYAQLKIEKKNSLNDVKYFCAAEIKSHFE